MSPAKDSALSPLRISTIPEDCWLAPLCSITEPEEPTETKEEISMLPVDDETDSLPPLTTATDPPKPVLPPAAISIAPPV